VCPRLYKDAVECVGCAANKMLVHLGRVVPNAAQHPATNPEEIMVALFNDLPLYRQALDALSDTPVNLSR
jgi:hypothetical protein